MRSRKLATPRRLGDFVARAMREGEICELEDGAFVGRIASCPGAIAFGPTPGKCRRELRSVLTDWVLLGLKLGHEIPVVGGVDLNE